jgi:hypothetical protein
MPGKRYRGTLAPDERGELENLISRGKGAARRLAHARILLHADQGEGRLGKTDAEIAEAVEVSVATIERVRQHFVEEGLEAALNPRPSPRLYPRKLDGEAEARLICKGWYSTYRTLSDQVGTHGFRRLAWRWTVPSSPAPPAHRWRGSGA